MRLLNNPVQLITESKWRSWKISEFQTCNNSTWNLSWKALRWTNLLQLGNFFTPPVPPPSAAKGIIKVLNEKCYQLKVSIYYGVICNEKTSSRRADGQKNQQGWKIFWSSDSINHLGVCIFRASIFLMSLLKRERKRLNTACSGLIPSKQWFSSPIFLYWRTTWVYDNIMYIFLLSV